MFSNFLIFVAPFIVIIVAIALAFLVAGKDETVNKES